MRRRVVITGIGVVSPIGVGQDTFLAGLKEGRDGSGEITRFSTRNFPVKRACEVKGCLPESGVDPFIQFGSLAAEEAFADCGMDLRRLDPGRFGIIASSSKGGMTAFSKGRFGQFFPHALSTILAEKFHAEGPVKCLVAACATGTLSIIDGTGLVERDEADLVLAGASDASITPLMFAAYHQLGVYASGVMCPYDRRRDGFLVGEGAGFVTLEERESALGRGARIYGEILACAMGAETYQLTSFDPEGEALARLLRRLLVKGDLKPSEIDYLNTHGTSTREGDIYETGQIKKAFGKEARKISMSSTKSMTGHMLGASGAVEVISCLLAMKGNFVPPTVNIEEPDPACDLDYTPIRSKMKEVRIACTFSMGFGGPMGAILIRR